MFGFMKKQSEKEREDKERKKREKKEKKAKMEKPLTQEELDRLEEAKNELYGKRSSVPVRPPRNGQPREGGAAVSASESSDSLSRETTPDTTYTSTARMDISRTVKVAPPTQPKPKKGILKGSNYDPNQGVRGQLDDTITLVENTQQNEIMSGNIPSPEEKAEKELQEKRRRVKSMASSFESSQLQQGSAPVPPRRGPPTKPNRLSKSQLQGPPPPAITMPVMDDLDTKIPFEENIDEYPSSPAEKIYANIDLQLPNVAPPRSVKPRALELKRLPAGDFGFTLRRGTVLERRGGNEKSENKRTVIFAEPGPKNTQTGLLPGDRLIEVNGVNVEDSSREDIIELIKKSTHSVSLKVQPIPELSELSLRSGLEGEELRADEQIVQGGTLKRSGSIRFKTRQAKSEEQVATEQQWMKAERVWLVHKGGFAAGRMQKTSAISEHGAGEEPHVKVKLDFGGEVLDVEEEDVEKCNPPQYDRVEDVANLRYMNESSVLHTLRQRYGSNLVHTYAGPVLIVINPMHPLSIYSEKVIHMFRGCKPEDMPPHIYASAQRAYRSMLSTRRDQAILFLGRSGAGKTTNARHVMHYLTVAAGSINGFLTVDKLNWIFALLDAFGNSRTIINTNATRYSQMVTFNFDHTGQIGSAAFQVLLLEKMRIAKRPEGEPTFHVFYQMLAGVDPNTRKELQLENMNEPNLFMTPLQRAEDRQKAAASWNKILQAFSYLNVSKEETKAIVSTLAAIYHLGVAGTVKGPTNKYQFGRPAAAQRAAAVLGTTVEELARHIFSPPTRTATTARGSPVAVAKDGGGEEDLTGLEALEGFVVALYSEVFNALVFLINRSLSTNYRTKSSICVLDTPGFQNPASCGRQTGATFDDLCHNYAQERLQMVFHDVMFTSKQDLYAQENIECDFELVTSSPAALVGLLDRPGAQSLVQQQQQQKEDASGGGTKGLLWLLEEEAIFPSASEDCLVEKMTIQYGSNANDKRGSNIFRRSGRQQFTISHFQGTNPVTYNTVGWLKACRENKVSRGVPAFLQEATREEIARFFSMAGSVTGSSGLSGSIVGREGSSSSLRRAPSMRRAFTTATKRNSVCLNVKLQVDGIMESLRRCQLHFVQCLLPQHNAGLSDLRTSTLAPNKAVTNEDALMNVPLVRAQIRGLELLEAIRIHRQGFPEHMLLGEFRHRFDFLAAPEHRSGHGDVVDEKAAVQKLLSSLDIDKSSYRIGLSQVFFRAGGLSQLEDLRDERITDKLVNLQARCRGYLGRKNLEKLRLQHLAVSCIQRNVRKFMAIREWPWWRLYVKCKPLLNVHRTEEELKDREVELEQTKAKLAKAEKERQELKQLVGALEGQLSDARAELQEETSAGTQATDVLESEQAERLRLEREHRELQARYGVLQRRLEGTEMDLHQARMLAAELDRDYDDDEESLDGELYRERYQRLQREVAFEKKKMQQDHEEELQQVTSQKQNIQKKLAESQDEAEDQRRATSNMKKKSVRLNQDMADLRLHLEEQIARNAELEKKQRKFDAELHKVTEREKEERQQREKIQRERDQLTSESIQAQQQIKSLQMDVELAAEKADRLDKAVEEITGASKDDKELMTVKRLKNELERKLVEQEEELDEQAGTIQQLEQNKLRVEMAGERQRQQHAKELEEKENELEEMRGTNSKRIRSIEAQLEEEYAQRQQAVKEKRDLERKIELLNEEAPRRNREMERALQRDLKRTKALLADAHVMLQKHSDTPASRATIKQLRSQLEDSQYAAAAAVKARRGVEMEVEALQAQLDAVQKSKQEADAKITMETRQRNEAGSRAEEVEEDYAELMKKYQAAVKQISLDTTIQTEQCQQLEEAHVELQSLKEQVAQLECRVEFLVSSTVDKQQQLRLEAKLREVESKLELESTARARSQTQLTSMKSTVERMEEEHAASSAESARIVDGSRRVDRELRELKEELAEAQNNQQDAEVKKVALEKKVEFLETEFDQSQADLKLAFKRISDLQAAVEEQLILSDDSFLGSDSEEDFADLGAGGEMDDSDSDED